ncbi:MAG TPA: hypothetical protein VHC44_02475 [Verrucomicrobiae bacterium]|nr:hypothetical protein [Verrucomicrobiae bacterium]
MKSPTNKLSTSSNTKRIFTALRGQILAGLLACLAFSAQATIQVTQFDPPLNISAYADAPADSYFNVLGTDFDANGEVDFRLAYGLGGISAFFNAPVRFGQRVSGPGIAGRGGPVAGLPLGSFIGPNLGSPVATNFYAWSPGDTNLDDLTQPFGDREATVIIANLVTYNAPLGPVADGVLFTNILFTNGPIPTVPVVSGDVVGRDCAIAVQFYVNGEVHYGYIHCDFRNGATGLIYGWAYETLPNVPIVAASLAPVPAQAKGPTGIVGFVSGGGVLRGWTISVSTAQGVFVKSVQTDKDGSFKMNLKPGLYTVAANYVPRPGPGQPLPNYVIMGASKSVIVTKNRFTFVELGTSL